MEFTGAAGWNLQNRLRVASQVAEAAWERRESRGVHYRDDFPERDDAQFGQHRVHPGQGTA